MVGRRRATLGSYAARIADVLRASGRVEVEVGGSGPARTIVQTAQELAADLVLVARQGAGGVNRADDLPLGSVPSRLIADLGCPLLIIPVTRSSSSQTTE